MLYRVLAAAAAVVLHGCAVYPYAELGLGVVRDRSTSYVMRSECVYVFAPESTDPRPCGGRNPTTHIRFGLEFERDAWLDRCELAHESHVRDGQPFNDRPEWHKDEAVCFKRWGGRDR